MKIDRTELLNKIFEFSIYGSGLVVGKPGIGKSYLLAQLRRELFQKKILSFLIKIDNVYDFSDDVIDAELGFDQNWIQTLKSIKLKDNQKAVLIFDAFDAARDESIRKGFLSQIKKAKNLLSEKCNVIVSVRTYDASKSSDLIRMFPIGNNPAESINCRKIEIDDLTEDDLLKAIEDNKRLFNFYLDSNLELKKILRIPFFLVLLEKLVVVSTVSELEEIKKYKSETQLLETFWQTKIYKSSDQIVKEQFLSAFTVALVNRRTLSLSRKDFLNSFPSLTDDIFTYLRSENIIDEVLNKTRLVYSHNILFDYAVSVFCITSDYEELLTFINTDQSRPFFLRPSFIYFFTSLWYQKREEFWKLYWKLFENKTKEIQLFVRLILNGVMVSEYADIKDLEPLTSYQVEETRSIVIRNALQSIRFIKTSFSKYDIDFLLLLSKNPNTLFLFDLAFLLDRAIEYTSKETGITKCGQAARSLFTFILTKRETENKYFLDRIGASRGVELVSRTYFTDKVASRKILSEIFKMLEEPQFEIFYFSNLCESIKYIVKFDPDFVAEVYQVIFGFTEISEQQTQMGSSVIANFTSNRRQDYEMCYYRLEEFFPSFLLAAPLIAIDTGLGIVNYIQTLVRKGSSETIKLASFFYLNYQCEYLYDMSVIWGDDSSSYKAGKLVDKIIDYLENQIVSGDEGYKNVVVEYIKRAKAGFEWKSLFKLGTRYPKQLVDLLYPLIIVPLFIESPDVSYEVREFIEKAGNYLNDEQILKIEEAIFSVYDESKTYVLSSALSRIPKARLQLERSKSFMREKQVTENEPAIKFSSSSGAYTTDMWLTDRGVDLSNPENGSLLSLNNQLESFNHTFLNNSPDTNDYKEYLSFAKEAYNKLTSSTREIPDDLYFSVLTEIAKTSVIVCRNLTNISNDDYAFLKEVISYSFNFKSQYDSQEPIRSPSLGWSPTPRIESAEALMNLYKYKQDNVILDLYKEAINDSNSTVRFHAVKSLNDLKHIDADEYWNILHDRLIKEDDAFIYASLLNNTEFTAEKLKEQAIEVINIAYNKTSFFTWKNNFLDSFTTYLLWLVQKHKLIEAKEMLIKGYERPEFCQAVIFKLFGSLHPSYVQNEFVEHPEKYKDIIDIIESYVDECERVLSNNKEEDLQIENKDIKNALAIINEIIIRIFFQIDAARIGRDNIRLPINENNRRAFYFLIKPIYKRIISLSSNTTGRGLISGHTAHYFIQSLNKVLQYDAKDILQMITDITRFSSNTGYTFDSLAVSEMVSITEKLLADHRDLLLDNDSFKNLIDLLDMYINSGWVEALQLLWKLDEVFK